jgi:hypothetical protein
MNEWSIFIEALAIYIDINFSVVLYYSSCVKKKRQCNIMHALISDVKLPWKLLT